MSSKFVKYPHLRRDVESAAECFADREFQAGVWANSTLPTPAGKWDLTDAFELISDDIGAGKLAGLLGDVLTSERELVLFTELHEALAAVAHLERSGPWIRYDEVASTEEWSRVQVAAAHLYEEMEIADRRNVHGGG